MVKLYYSVRINVEPPTVPPISKYKIASNDQVADGFIKALPVKKLDEFKRNLNLFAS
jgi:hypothetical protein